MTPRLARGLVLTGVWLSLIFFGFALFVHNRLYDKDLERGAGLEQALREQLSAPVEPSPPHPSGGALDELERLLATPPDARAPVAGLFYDAAELSAFDTAVALGPFERGPRQERTLVAPQAVEAVYSNGVVTVSWSAGSLNELLASALAAQGGDQRVAFRVYRTIGHDQARLMEAIPFGRSVWKDRDLPLGASVLTYEVWAVVLRDGASGEVLLGAERSEAVTVTTPDHFTLKLLGGTADTALLEVRIERPPTTLTVAASIRVGEELRAGELPTGLRLQSIRQETVDILGAKRRWLFTPEGGLVLDPVTHQPRTTETQVLQPVTRWTAVLDPIEGGSPRTLQADLP